MGLGWVGLGLEWWVEGPSDVSPLSLRPSPLKSGASSCKSNTVEKIGSQNPLLHHEMKPWE